MTRGIDFGDVQDATGRGWDVVNGRLDSGDEYTRCVLILLLREQDEDILEVRSGSWVCVGEQSVMLPGRRREDMYVESPSPWEVGQCGQQFVS